MLEMVIDPLIKPRKQFGEKCGILTAEHELDFRNPSWTLPIFTLKQKRFVGSWAFEGVTVLVRRLQALIPMHIFP